MGNHTDLIRFALAVYACTALTAMLAKAVRFYRKPFDCPLCMGFWFGLAVSYFFFGGDLTLSALIGSGSAYLLNRWVTGDY